ncbi:MAG TPA: glycosyltransferase family 39 protein [Gemmatimonadaceae bacterium]|nr:glycosyltransferase family 39 protein [Gemmatimonadaceae bacterium]
MTDSVARARWWWRVALFAALAFAVADGIARLRRIDALTNASLGAPRTLATDARTPTGLAANQHRVILGNNEADGYEWLMQTEDMLARRAVRVRHVDNEAAEGRDVHWSSALRWWTAGLAFLATPFTHDGIVRGSERVARWADAALLVLFLVLVARFVRTRFGTKAGALVALGFVFLAPVYEPFQAGNFDHHGMAELAAVLSVLFVATALRKNENDRRRWMAAAGVAGGVGLWISAATQVPVLLGVGIGALVTTVTARRSASEDSPLAPALWRSWGLAGAITSLVFYAIEYLPAHAGLRLEVNNPLYALAWFAGADLIASVGSRRALPRVLAGAAGLAVLPTVIIAVPRSFVLRPGSLLTALSADYISEIQPLRMFLLRDLSSHIDEKAALVFVALAATVAAFAMLRGLSRDGRDAVVVCAAPAAVFTVLAIMQYRWFGVACALWVVATVAAIPQRAGGSRPGRAIVTAVGAIALGVLPLNRARGWIAHGLADPIAPANFAEIITRDVSQKLRLRLGDERGVVLTEPTTTTWMEYFGGVRGIGTLYWENTHGLAEAARVFAAPSDTPAADSARALVRRYGITHIVLYSWSPFAEEYARLGLGIRVRSVPADSQLSALRRSFGVHLLRGEYPAWLRPLSYHVPDGYGAHSVRVLEVAPDQSADEASTWTAQYYYSLQQRDSAEQRVDAVLARHPGYLPALLLKARMALAGTNQRSDQHAADSLVRAIRAPRPDSVVTFKELVGVAIVEMQAGDTLRARNATRNAIARATPAAVRALPWGTIPANFALLIRRFGLDSLRPDIAALNFAQLDPAIQAQVRGR